MLRVVSISTSARMRRKREMQKSMETVTTTQLHATRGNFDVFYERRNFDAEAWERLPGKLADDGWVVVSQKRVSVPPYVR